MIKHQLRGYSFTILQIIITNITPGKTIQGFPECLFAENKIFKIS
jgi:hypothetical protein